MMSGVHSRWKRLFCGMFTSADEAPLRPRLARFPGDDPTAEGKDVMGLHGASSTAVMNLGS
jgi:hypothetical protein